MNHQTAAPSFGGSSGKTESGPDPAWTSNVVHAAKQTTAMDAQHRAHAGTRQGPSVSAICKAQRRREAKKNLPKVSPAKCLIQLSRSRPGSPPPSVPVAAYPFQVVPFVAEE